jgi:hypothetical protein
MEYYYASEERRRRHICRSYLKAYVRAGRIERKPCEICGDTKVEGHHHDYTKPLDVRWLCVKHHRECHAMTDV